MEKRIKNSLAQKAMKALSAAVARVVEKHRRQGRPLAVWIPAKEIGLLETPTRYRLKR
jgi:hypothetical protein